MRVPWPPAGVRSTRAAAGRGRRMAASGRWRLPAKETKRDQYLGSTRATICQSIFTYLSTDKGNTTANLLGVTDLHDCICSSDPADYLYIASASSAASSHGDLIPTSPSVLKTSPPLTPGRTATELPAVCTVQRRRGGLGYCVWRFSRPVSLLRSGGTSPATV